MSLFFKCASAIVNDDGYFRQAKFSFQPSAKGGGYMSVWLMAGLSIQSARTRGTLRNWPYPQSIIQNIHPAPEHEIHLYI